MSRAQRRGSSPAEPTAAAADLSSVAERLRALADACDPQSSAAAVGADPDIAPISSPEVARRVRTYLVARRRRDALLGPGWFADPAWDILLDLLACGHENRRITVSSACIAAAVPATTALRWIKALVDGGVVLRIEDPADRRRVFVELAPEFAERLGAWVASSLAASDA